MAKAQYPKSLRNSNTSCTAWCCLRFAARPSDGDDSGDFPQQFTHVHACFQLQPLSQSVCHELVMSFGPFLFLFWATWLTFRHLTSLPRIIKRPVPPSTFPPTVWGLRWCMFIPCDWIGSPCTSMGFDGVRSVAWGSMGFLHMTCILWLQVGQVWSGDGQVMVMWSY